MSTPIRHSSLPQRLYVPPERRFARSPRGERLRPPCGAHAFAADRIRILDWPWRLISFARGHHGARHALAPCGVDPVAR
jgi:hypothetical protein